MARKKGFKLISLRKKRRGRPKKKKGYWKLILALLVIFIIIPGIIAFMWFKKNILEKLPDVSKIENVVFSQTTTITDRNGIILYKVFNENRKYVKLNEISKNTQNALIAIEDKNFWKNPGIDIQGIIRAGIHDVIFGKKQGASTLTQQIIKNLILTRERTIKRKLKEIVLAFELNKYLSDKVRKQYKDLSEKEVKKKVKEQILEMYLNYVFFGNNAYGVEAAANTYFHKKAKNLSILESAILASIPKSPVKYDPINNRKNNLGELVVYNNSGDIIQTPKDLKILLEKTYIDYLKDQAFGLKKDENDIINMISPKNLKFKNFIIAYKPGRKDFVLARMYLDGYIDKNQLIEAIKEGFNKVIYSTKIEIKAPHFVFYVLKQLETKYGKDVINKAGWTIKTSLDYKIQETAEETIKAWSGYLEKKGANNTALLYVNSKNGDIIAYVGSKDYYNKKIDGQVDIITSKRQCGSVIKPLIYANAFIKNKYFTPDSPIYDTEFDIADKGNTFNNFDGKFLGLMPIRKALPYSRNIPAAKMYYLGGGETSVKKFLKNIGISTISNKLYYGYPLAIGAVEVKLLDFAQAYSYLSNIDGARKINPILEIKGPDGSIIYKKQEEKLKQIIPQNVISLLWYILSNTKNLPPSWVSAESIPGLKFATKSGTTNIIDKKTRKKYPRDGWFVGYTPSKVMIVWAGNTKGEHMHSDAYGGWTAGKVWKDFVTRLQKAKLIQNEDMKENGTTSIYINTINGKKSSSFTPIQVSQKTLARIDGIPAEDDGKTIKTIKIDTLCTGLVSEYTPVTDIKTAYIINAHSYRPNDKRWEEGVQTWWQTEGKEKYAKILGGPILFKEPTSICEDRLIIAKKGKLKFNIVYPKNNQKVSHVFDIWINVEKQPFPLSKYEVYLDGKKISTETYKGNILGVYLPDTINDGPHNIKIRLIDEKGYLDEKDINLIINKKDNQAPYIDKKIERNGKYIYYFKDNESKVLGGFIYCNGQKTRFRTSIVSVNKNCSKISVMDYFGNTAEFNINN